MAYEGSYKARKLFLEFLEQGWSPSKAARSAGHRLQVFKKLAQEDENFRRDWEDAEATGTDYLEDVARKRAVRSSDQLLTTLLKARRPDKYRERSQVEHAGSIDFSGEREKLNKKLARALAEDEESAQAS